MPREILQLGNPILRQKSANVEDLDSVALKELISELFESMQTSKGVGIAAPQIGELKRVFIISSHPNERYPHAPLMEPRVIVNPEIIWDENHPYEHVKDWEGCLSIPGLRGLVPRHARIQVRFIDGLSKEQVSCEYSGFIARIFQHEFDHLEGVLFVDRVENSRDLYTEQEFLKIIAQRTSNPKPI